VEKRNRFTADPLWLFARYSIKDKGEKHFNGNESLILQKTVTKMTYL